MPTNRPKPKAAKTAGAKAAAAPGGVAEPKLVGRRFTKREESALDSANYFDLKRAKAAALVILSAAGYEESSLYGPIGECFALERVRADGFDDDSPEGLAGQVLWCAREIESWIEYYGMNTLSQSAKHVMDYAYRIGRCHAFAKAYGILSKDGGPGRPQAVTDQQIIDTWGQTVRDAGGKTHGAIGATANRLGIDRKQCSQRLRRLGLIGG